jgi:hypothetical protein
MISSEFVHLELNNNRWPRYSQYVYLHFKKKKTSLLLFFFFDGVIIILKQL